MADPDRQRGGPDAAGELLDRGAETAVLDRAVREVLAGRGGLVVVDGPAGIGKTRLLDEAATTFRDLGAGRAIAVVAGAGDELHRHRALGLLRGLRDDAGRPLAGLPAATASAEQATRAPEGDGIAPPDGGATAVQDALRVLTSLVGTGRAAAVLVLVDDLHWADTGSLRALEELAALAPELPLLLVAATRPHEPGAPDGQLDRLRARAGVGWLRPGPLSPEAIARLAAAGGGRLSPATLEALVLRSGGNPFLVRELLRAGPAGVAGDAIPDAVRHSVRLHLRRLPAAATELARAVAVLGVGTPLRTAAALVALDPVDAEAAADALGRADVLRPGDPLTFAHALIADAVRAELDPFARARLHRRAAELLHEQGAGDDAVAAQLLQTRADGDPWVATTLLRVARATNAAGDPEAAGRLLERARREPPPLELRGEVAGALAEADALAGRDGAAQRLGEALELIDDPRRRVELRYVLSRAFHLGQRFDAAARASRAALDDLPPGDPLHDRVLSGWMTDALFVPDLHPEDDPRVAAVRHELRDGGEAAGPLLAHALNLASMDDAPRAVIASLARRAVSRDPVVDVTAHGAPLTHVATGLLHADLLDELVEITTAAVDAGRARSNALATMTALGGRAFGRHLLGDLDGARADAHRSFEISRSAGTPYSGWWIAVLAETHLTAGDADGAGEALALRETATIPAFGRLRLEESAAAVALAGGDPERAVAIASAAEDRRRGMGAIRLSMGTADGRWVLVRALVALGRVEEAVAVADDLVAATDGVSVARRRAEALLMAAVARGAEGVAPAREAVALLRRSPARVALLRGLTDLGVAHRAAGEDEAARDALLEALELAARLGLARREDELRALLRSVGARPRQPARSGPAALTAAELDVARLAAEGLGNPAIAARRHVSRKTVETHLGRAYRKLGIDSRGALARALDGHGPPEG